MAISESELIYCCTLNPWGKMGLSVYANKQLAKYNSPCKSLYPPKWQELESEPKWLQIDQCDY